MSTSKHDVEEVDTALSPHAESGVEDGRQVEPLCICHRYRRRRACVERALLPSVGAGALHGHVPPHAAAACRREVARAAPKHQYSNYSAAPGRAASTASRRCAAVRGKPTDRGASAAPPSASECSSRAACAEEVLVQSCIHREPKMCGRVGAEAPSAIGFGMFTMGSTRSSVRSSISSISSISSSISSSHRGIIRIEPLDAIGSTRRRRRGRICCDRRAAT